MTGALVAAIISVVGMSLWGRWNGATLTLPNDPLELGALPVGERTISIPVRNTGRRPIAIKSAYSSCPGRVLDFPASIPPGKSASIRLKMRITPGTGTSGVTVHLGSGKIYHVGLRWYGIAPLVADPPAIADVLVPVGRPFESRVWLLYHAGDGQTVFPECHWSVEGLEAAVVRDLQPGFPRVVGYPFGASQGPVFEMPLVVRVPSPQRPSEVTATVSITLRWKDWKQSLSIPIHLRFVGELVLLRKTVVFSAATAQSLLEVAQVYGKLAL
ncbi:MAG TPA: DUF1573 domain-containing protein [Planctomycetaceae bacterium]|nr:DUF1573 domain-containing protein [Planctomycetaceae bacterium]